MEFVVYFIRSANGSVKIGYASNVERHLYDLQIASPDELSCVATIPCGTKQQALKTVREVHETLRDCHMRGGWFAPSKQLDRWIEQAQPYSPPNNTISRGRISEARSDPDRHPRSSIRWSEVEFPAWMDEVDRKNLIRHYHTPAAVRSAIKRAGRRYRKGL